MAKSPFLLYGATGKVGNVVLQKDAYGDTVVREKVTPKNPKTDAQRMQRIFMNTVSQAYSKMKNICDHSFEGIDGAAKNMSRFMAINADLLRYYTGKAIEQGMNLDAIYSFTPISQKFMSVNPYRISQGSLPQVPIAEFDSEAGPSQGFQVQLSTVTSLTYQEICDAFGLRRGDQLTFVEVSGETNATFQFKYCRVVLDPVLNGVSASMETPFIFNGGINAPSPRNENTQLFFFYANTGDAKLSFFSDSVVGNLAAGGVIVSRKVDSKWLRSTCDLFVVERPVGYNGLSMYNCLYELQTNIQFEGSRFLNNAGQGRVILNNGQSAGGDTPISGVELTLSDGSVITAVSARVEGGFVLVTDSEGVSHKIYCNDEVSMAYSAHLKAMTGYLLNSNNQLNTNTWTAVGQTAGDTDIEIPDRGSSAFAQKVAALGIEWTVFFGTQPA